MARPYSRLESDFHLQVHGREKRSSSQCSQVDSEVKQRFSRLQQQVLRPFGPDMPTTLSRMQRRYSCDAHVFREGMNAEDTIAELDDKAIAVREIYSSCDRNNT